MNSKNIAPGIYKHFKGEHYQVIGIAKHSETLEDYVVYKQLYGDHATWIRPASMFLEMVNRDGKLKPRFQKIED